eukprot:2588612-Amphidinium_carterae.1
MDGSERKSQRDPTGSAQCARSVGAMARAMRRDGSASGMMSWISHPMASRTTEAKAGPLDGHWSQVKQHRRRRDPRRQHIDNAHFKDTTETLHIHRWVYKGLQEKWQGVYELECDNAFLSVRAVGQTIPSVGNLLAGIAIRRYSSASASGQALCSLNLEMDLLTCDELLNQT